VAVEHANVCDKPAVVVLYGEVLLVVWIIQNLGPPHVEVGCSRIIPEWKRWRRPLRRGRDERETIEAIPGGMRRTSYKYSQ